MGFNKVYKALQEVFPEVDCRLLKAVAIEHQKDANSAVEVVLTEVIPYLTENSSLSKCANGSRTAEQTPSSSSDSSAGVQSPEGQGASLTPCKKDARLRTAICPDEDQPGQFYDAESDHDQLFHDENSGRHQICGDSSIGKLNSVDETVILTVCVNASSPVPSALLENGNEADADHHLCGDNKTEDTITSGNYQESCIGVVYNKHTQSTSSASEHENLDVDHHINNSLHVESVNGEIYKEKNCADGEVVAVHDSLGHLNRSSCGSSEMSSTELATKSAVMRLILNTDDTIQSNDSESDVSKVGCSSDSADVIDKSTLTTGVTPSAQIRRVDLLEDIIADARNNKKTLFSAMESVISLMREVELQEKAVEQAKEEAAEGGLELFKRVEELKETLQHAKEANDMHAGEVYGEKAILATELRELQSRLLSLSDERDKSLCILDEMRQSLEVRLAAAEKEREAAEKEKLEKEEIGRKLLAEQEKIMEKVVEEANTLKQEAEENAKLQDFLVDRGRLVDILQGEISVICQDVRLLKEKFDERLPLSKSLTSSQTSCILASSSSSLKSMTPEQGEQLTETAMNTELAPSLVQAEYSAAETAAHDDEALINDEWEIFDNPTLL